MRRGVGTGLGLASFAAALVPTTEARADDDVAGIVAAVTVISAAFGADVAFTAYDAGRTLKNLQPDTKWMTAQTIVTSPQAVISHVPLILATTERHSEALGLLLPLSIWGNQMATYGAWSLVTDNTAPRARYGVSWLTGADLPLSSTAIAGFFTDAHYTRPWHSISEIALCTPQVVYGIYQGAHDPTSRGDWIAIAAWSGALVVHGTTSLVLSLTRKKVDPEPPPPPPPQPPPYYYNDPVQQLPAPAPGALDRSTPPPDPLRQSAPAPQPVPSPPAQLSPHAPKLHADIAPTPISAGFRMVPGISVFGTF